jgi:hypothetical protein
LWYAHATGNYALQSHELHHREYPQFNNHSSMPSSYNHPPQESLEQHFPTAHIDDLEEMVTNSWQVGVPIPNLLTLMHLISHVHIVIILLTG